MSKKLAICVVSIVFLLGLSINQSHTQAAVPVELEGYLTILYGDGLAGETQTAYFLITSGGIQHALTFPRDFDFQLVRQLNGQPVVVTGYTELNTTNLAGESALVVNSLTSNAPENQQLDSTMAVTPGSYPFISLLCRFPDAGGTESPLSYFVEQYSSSYPGLSHYWQESSYGKFDLNGSTALNWKTLPQNKIYYHDQQTNPDTGAIYYTLNHSRLTDACTALFDAEVNFAAFEGINMMFDENFMQNYAWGGSQWRCLDGRCRSWPMTWEPPWGWGNTSVLSHETGHAFRLPHSSGHDIVYNNSWDVMSDNWDNCYKLSDPTYKCLGQHTIGYHKELLGVFSPDRIQTVGIGQQATIAMERMSLPQTTNVQYVKVPINGSTQYFYTVEVRYDDPTAGYDQKLPGTAVILHSVDTSDYMPADVIDPGTDNDTGDEGAMWVVGETFTDEANGITISVLSQSATGFVVEINNNYTYTETIPTLIAPEGSIYNRRPEFSWSEETNLTQFNLQIFADSAPIYDENLEAAAVCAADTCAVNPGLGDLAFGTDYTWQVRGFDGTTWHPFSDPMAFTVVPVMPVTISPVVATPNNTTDYVWEAVDGADRYQVQLWQDATLLEEAVVANDICSTGTCTFTFATVLERETDYKWHVRAKIGGWHPYSSWSGFRFGTSAPVAMSPITSTNDSTPTYTWQAVDGAYRYQLRLFRGTTLLVDKIVSRGEACSGDVCSVTLLKELSVNPTYQWTVRAKRYNIWSLYTPKEHFQYIPD